MKKSSQKFSLEHTVLKYWLFFFSLYTMNLEALQFIFAHGLGGDKSQIYWYKEHPKNNWHIMPNKSISFDFADVLPLGFNRAKVNLAQEGDIATLEQVHKNLKEPVVLVGVSRGAATVLNYAALKKPENIKALIAESPFDSLESIIEHAARTYGAPKELIAQQWTFGEYKPNGIKPLDLVSKIDKNIPVLFIHSKQDKLVPVESSRKLYQALKKAGHKHVYLLELATGEHANYQASSSKDVYRAAVHAFYKKYNIPHDAKLAAQGEKYLKTAQP